jgi:pyruvate,water dikinase
MILPINSPAAKLENAGGKGTNLSKLIRAGFPVPDGFIVTTDDYFEFVKANNLGEKIQVQIAESSSQDSSSLERISKAIRASFTGGRIPNQITRQVEEAYTNLGNGPVAVRSSATAEDLPDLSFAGQQDTFLNVVGVEALLTALINCWSSLWTARAIGYRTKNEIPHAEVALAVIVQEMVPAEVSGVLFTANPLTGSWLEAVVDATFGLGEALVSGHVEPDHYVVDLNSGQIIKKSIGSKQVALHGKANCGLHTKRTNGSKRESLTENELNQLVELGKQVTGIYNFPQDIEWGIARGEIYLLQSRPITSLFPIPDGMSPEPLQALFSFASVQGIIEPITPLGQDAIRLIFAGGGSLFGFDVTHETQGLRNSAGERLWVNITASVHHPIGSRAAIRFLSVVDPYVQQTLKSLKDEHFLKFGRGRIRISTLHRLLVFINPIIKRVLRYMRSPDGVAAQIMQASQSEIAQIKEKSQSLKEDGSPLEQSLELFNEIFNVFPFAVPEIAPGFIAGLIPFFVLNRISNHLTGSPDLALAISRGMPHNVTIEMDLKLWETARKIRSDETVYEHFNHSEPVSLAKQYLEKTLPVTTQTAITRFLDEYGMRGLGEIDIGRQRWNEDPTYIFEVIKSYLHIEDEELAPDIVYRKGEQASSEAITKLQEIARRTFAGSLKAKIINSLAERVHSLAGLRESPKFHIIQVMGIIREALLENGQELASAGTFEQADEIFYLYLTELEELAKEEDRDWITLINERKSAYQRELHRVQIPRLLLSDGRAFYEGLVSVEVDGERLIGSPVSPGIVEGIVRVVNDPINADLKPGEILVCPRTDPAWTPLFLAASGLITELGGMMTHGAIVAREYGIPAVVGINQATTVLRNGQRIKLNGSTGEILLVRN